TYDQLSRDEVYGTMWRGASNSIAYFLILVMLPLLGIALRKPEIRWPRWAVMVILVPFVLASSRGAYILFPILFLIAFWEHVRENPVARTILAWCGAAGTVLFTVYYFLKPESQSMEGTYAEMNPVRLVTEQLDPKYGMGRLYFLGYLYDLFHREG